MSHRRKRKLSCRHGDEGTEGVSEPGICRCKRTGLKHAGARTTRERERERDAPSDNFSLKVYLSVGGSIGPGLSFSCLVGFPSGF